MTSESEKLSVLLVEDNELNQEVAATFMARRGVAVTIAGNGQEALDWVQRRPFDLVLMDLHMPVMGGIEATQRIHELPGHADLPIVAMTAAVLEEDQQRCLAAGMADFIAKPIEPEDLVRVLGRHAGTASGPPAEKSPSPERQAPLLDLAAGLRRLDGDRALQQRLLLGFVERYHDVVARLDALLAETDGVAAIDLVHNLKGIAANLGATALAEVCRRLIEELRAGAPLDSRATFVATLKETLEQLQRHIARPPQPGLPATTMAAAVPLGVTVRALEPFILGQEVVPDVLLAGLRQLADAGLPHSPLARRLLQHLDGFEHDAALEVFNLLKLEQGVEP